MILTPAFLPGRVAAEQVEPAWAVPSLLEVVERFRSWTQDSRKTERLAEPLAVVARVLGSVKELRFMQ